MWSEPSLSFPPCRRRCCSCLRLGAPSEFLRCSRCKAFVYCDQDCQREHWKRTHKKCCQPPTKSPPAYAPLPWKADDDPDLDARYKYILVAPGEDRPSYAAFVASARGINDEAELDSFLADPLNADDRVKTVLKDRYRWPSGPGAFPVPGFRDLFDGTHMRCVADHSFQTCMALDQNIISGYIMMMPLAKAKGIFIFSAIDTSKDSSTEQSSTANIDTVPGEPFFITRREVLSLGLYHSTCGNEDCLSERIHFENISRKEALMLLRRENFITLPVDKAGEAIEK